jgi:hypothetical protein
MDRVDLNDIFHPPKKLANWVERGSPDGEEAEQRQER